MGLFLRAFIVPAEWPWQVTLIPGQESKEAKSCFVLGTGDSLVHSSLDIECLTLRYLWIPFPLLLGCRPQARANNSAGGLSTLGKETATVSQKIRKQLCLP